MYTILVVLLLVLEVHVGLRLTSIYRRSLHSSTVVARPPQTGDLILFLGNPFLSYVLNSPFTHVGIVVALAKGPVVLHLPPEQNQPCVCDLNLLKGEHVAYRSIKIGLSTAKMRKLMRQAFAYDFESWKTVFHHVREQPLLSVGPEGRKRHWQTVLLRVRRVAIKALFHRHGHALADAGGLQFEQFENVGPVGGGEKILRALRKKKKTNR